MRDRKSTGFHDNQAVATEEIVKVYSKPKIWDWFTAPDKVWVVLLPFVCVSASVAFPGFGPSQLLNCWPYPEIMGYFYPIILIFSSSVLLFRRPPAMDLPFRIPKQAGGIDHHLKDDKGRPQRSNGVEFVGNEIDTGKEVWRSTDEMKQHSLTLGTTGAGKTETALGIAANALAMGSGFMFLDAKADIDFYYKVLALARRFGREDDVRFLNFANVSPDSEAWHSNNMNFLFGLPKDEMANLLVGLMSDMGGDNKVFKDRAEQLLLALVGALVWLRDNRGWSLTISLIRSYLDLEDLIKFGQGIDIAGRTIDMPEHLKRGIMDYIGGLAGVRKSAMNDFAGQLGNRQPKQGAPPTDPITPEMTKQHGFVIMQLTRMMGRLASDYAHIFNIRYGDVNLDDIILNRRILIIQIPVLAKARTEVEALAKIMVANISMMMSRALGSRTRGTVKDVVEARSTSSPSPYPVIFDEAGCYIVEGMENFYKQGRSLNCAFYMLTQDITALRQFKEKVADQVIGSANFVTIMKIQDVKTTGEFAIQTADKGIFGLTKAFERKPKVGGVTADDDRNYSIDVRNKLTFADLQAQSFGEATTIANGRVIRYKTFRPQPTKSIDSKKFRSLFVRRFMSWDYPSPADIAPRDLVLPGSLDGANGREVVSRKGLNTPEHQISLPGISQKPTMPGVPHYSMPVDSSVSLQTVAGPAFGVQSISQPVGRIKVPPKAPRAPLVGPPPGGNTDLNGIITKILTGREERAAKIENEMSATYYLLGQNENDAITPVMELQAVASRLQLAALSPTGPLDAASAMMGSVIVSTVRLFNRRLHGKPPYVPAEWLIPGMDDADLMPPGPVKVSTDPEDDFDDDTDPDLYPTDELNSRAEVPSYRPTDADNDRSWRQGLKNTRQSDDDNNAGGWQDIPPPFDDGSDDTGQPIINDDGDF